MLLKSGIKLKDLSKYDFLDNLDNVVLSVLAGDFDAGAVKENVFYKYKKYGLKKIAVSPDIPEHIFVASSKLTTDKIKALRKALWELDQKESGKIIMKNIVKNMTAIRKADDAQYKPLRQILKYLDDTNNKNGN